MGALDLHAGGMHKAMLFDAPRCSWCEVYAAYLRTGRFEVDIRTTKDLTEISRKAGVPADFQDCHTTFIDGYATDGHVPVDTVDKLLTERPDIVGIALPAMPTGSPGMQGTKTDSFTIFTITKDGKTPAVYTKE
jgi:hypothetical protein